MKRFVLLVTTLLLWCFHVAQAQAQVGICQDQLGSRFAVFDQGNGSFTFQNMMMPVSFTGMRDPTGITFLQWQIPGMPAQQFINWQGQVIHIQPGGWMQIGVCQFSVPYSPPQLNINLPPQGKYGVIFQDNTRKIPDQFLRHGNEYLPPLMASEQTAKDCWAQAAGNRSRFADCLNGRMLSGQQKAAYDCYKGSAGDETSFALCVVKIGMGQNERKAVDDLNACYKKYGSDWRQYPTCYFSNSNDPNVARAAQCLQKQAQKADTSFWSFAGCYGVGALGANAELQVAAECAMASGGEPITFAGCTGGKLTAMELDKCWANGVGGSNGCFGPNNTIVQYMRQLGVDTDRLLNRNGAIINGFNTVINDLRNGPGPTNDGVRFLNDVGKQVQNLGSAGSGAKQEVNQGLKRLGLPFRL